MVEINAEQHTLPMKEYSHQQGCLCVSMENVVHHLKISNAREGQIKELWRFFGICQVINYSSYLTHRAEWNRNTCREKYVGLKRDDSLQSLRATIVNPLSPLVFWPGPWCWQKILSAWGSLSPFQSTKKSDISLSWERGHKEPSR